MSHFGNFGHSAILLPASLALFVFLIWLGRRADALAFIAALIVCLATALVAKLVVHACEASLTGSGIESPSGHVSLGAVFYGCLALLIAAGRPRWQRIVLYAGAALLVLLIGASRVFVAVHTLPDVWAGAVIGVVSILVFQALRGPPRRLVAPLAAVAFGVPVAALLLLILLSSARGWTPEPLIAAAARQLDRSLNACAAP